MNLADAAAAIDVATAILQQDNDRAERLAYWRGELARCRAAGALTHPGTSRRLCANLRIVDAEVAIINIERETT